MFSTLGRKYFLFTLDYYLCIYVWAIPLKEFHMFPNVDKWTSKASSWTFGEVGPFTDGVFFLWLMRGETSFKIHKMSVLTFYRDPR